MEHSSIRLHAGALIFFAATVMCSFAQAPSGSSPGSTVVYVGGNDLVVKASDGKLLNFTVPPGYRFSAGGKELTLAELKPGITLAKSVSTGTNPKTVSAVTVIKGKVYATTPPSGITLVLTEGAKDFTVPSGTTFKVGAKAVSLNDLKPDMMVEATVVTTAPEAAPPEAANAVPPATPPMTGALLLAKAEGEGELPLAGTNLPLFGLVGSLLLALGIGLVAVRKPQGQP